MSYRGHSLGGGLTPLQRCSQCILQPKLTGQCILWEYVLEGKYSLICYTLWLFLLFEYKGVSLVWLIFNQDIVVIYKAFCLDVAQGRMNGAWESNSLVKACYCTLLTITPPGVPFYQNIVTCFSSRLSILREFIALVIIPALLASCFFFFFPFSIATTPRCRGGYYSFPWIAPLYPWYGPYIAEC